MGFLKPGADQRKTMRWQQPQNKGPEDLTWVLGCLNKQCTYIVSQINKQLHRQTHMYLYMYMYMYMYVYMYMYIYICICMCLCMCVCVYVYVCMHVCIHIHISIYIFKVRCFLCVYTSTCTVVTLYRPPPRILDSSCFGRRVYRNPEKPFLKVFWGSWSRSLGFWLG